MNRNLSPMNRHRHLFMGCIRPSGCFALVFAVLLLAPALALADQTKANNTSPLTNTTSWVSGTVPGSSDLAIFDNTITAAQTNALGVGSLSILGISYGNVGGIVTIANTAGSTLTLGASGIDMSSAARDFNLNCFVALGEPQTWNVASGKTNACAGTAPQISGGTAGTTILTKEGTGALGLSQANSFAGDLVINGGLVYGTVAFNGANSCFGAKDTARTITINNGGTLQFRVAQLLQAINNATYTVPAIVVNPGGTLEIHPTIGSGYQGFGNITLNSGRLLTGKVDSRGTATLGGTVTVGVGNGTASLISNQVASAAQSYCPLGVQDTTVGTTFDVADATGDAAPDLIVQAVLGINRVSSAAVPVSPLALTKIGNGTMQLLGSNLFTGSTVINAGVLSIGSDGTTTAGYPLGRYPAAAVANNVSMDGGTLQVTANTTMGVNRGVTLGVNGGGFDVRGNDVALNVNGIIDGSSAPLTVSQSSGSGGIVVLNAANTYSGNTLISSGTLKLSAAGSIDNSPIITVNANTTLDLTEKGGYTIASGKTLAGGSTINSATVNVGSGNVLTMSGDVTNSFQASGASIGKISVVGDLALNNQPIIINVTNETLEAGVYRLLDCTGTLTGTANATPEITGFGLAVGTSAAIATSTGSAGYVDLVVTVTNGDPAPAGMYFSVQPPASTAAGAIMSPAVVVTVTNAAGTAYTTRPAVVALSVVSPGGTLLGTVSKKTSLIDGTATFDDLSVTLAGSGKVLRATNTFGAITADSGTFAITGLAPVKLVVATQPSATANAGVAFAQQPVVNILDAFGNLTTSGASITVTQNVGGTLQGTTTVTASSGVAMFSGLYATNLGTIKLNFTSAGLSGVSSSDIVLVAGAPTQMRITTAIGTNQVNSTAFTPASTTIKLYDQFGNWTDSSANVTANLGSTTGGTLAGTLTVGTASGTNTATFADLNFALANSAAPETGVEVYFTSAGLPPVTNVLFTVNPVVTVSYVQPPTSANVGAIIQPNVTVLVTDASANPVIGQTVTIRKLTGSGTLYGTLTAVTAVDGVATFTDLSFLAAGDKTLRATIFGTSADSGPFTISGGAFTQLQVLAPGETNMPDTVTGKIGTPRNQFVGSSFDVTVNAVDAYFNIDPNAASLIHVTTSETGDTEPADNTLSAGTQSFTITPLVAPSSLTVTAQSGSLTSTSSSISVIPYPAYRTRQSGNWNDFNTWQRDAGLGGGFVNAIAGQTPTSLDGFITITNGITVTVSNNVSVDQVTVNAGGTVVVTNGTLTIADGAAAYDMEVSGILKKSLGGITTTTGALRFNNGGKYDHHMNGGEIVTATWAVGSTCEITGPDGTSGFNNNPTGFGQAFHHFTWNCPSITTRRTLSGALTTVNGDYTLLVVGANEGTANSAIRHFSSAEQVLTIGGNFLVASGAGFEGIGGGDGGTLRVAGNVTLKGPNGLGSSGASTTLEFGGTGTPQQIFTNAPGGIFNGKWHVTVGSTANVKFASDMGLFTTAGDNRFLTVNGRLDTGTNAFVSGAFTANSGATLTTANADGGVTTTGPVAFGSVADVIFNGTVAQTSGSVLRGNPNNVTNLGPVGLTLIGTGSVAGNLVGGTRLEGSGNTVLTVNNLILPGTTVMKLNDTIVPTSDRFSFTTLAASGPLVITNVGPTITNGTVFTLFGSAVSGFTSITLPGAPYVWLNELTTNGTLTLVTGGALPAPPKLDMMQSGNSLSFSWTGNFKLQSQTNSLDAGLSTNDSSWFDYPDPSNPVNVEIDPANPTVFFRLKNQ